MVYELIVPLLTGIKNMLLLLDFQSIQIYCHAFKYIYFSTFRLLQYTRIVDEKVCLIKFGKLQKFFHNEKRKFWSPYFSVCKMTKLTIDVQSIWETNQPSVNGRVSEVSLKVQSHVINRFRFYYILHTTINWNLTIYLNLIPKLMLQSLNKFL